MLILRKSLCLLVLLTTIPAAPLTVFSSCTKPNEESHVGPPDDGGGQETKPDIKKVSIAFDTCTLDYESSSFTIGVTAEGAWSVESDSDWCSVEAAGDHSIKLSVAENATDNDRKAYVKVTSEDNISTDLVVVTQYSPSSSSQGWQKQNIGHTSLGLLFTATWCPFSPRLDRNLAVVNQELDGNINLLALHEKDSKLVFPDYQTLTTLFHVEYAPVLVIDGRYSSPKWTYSGYFDDFIIKNLVETFKQSENDYPCYSSIALKSLVTGDEYTAKVRLNLKKAGDYALSVFLVEDNVDCPQEDDINGYHESYLHDNVLRMALSDVLGDKFTTEKDHMVKDFSYSATLPEAYQKDNLKILVVCKKTFGSENHKTSDDFGDYYVDNSFYGSLGVSKSSGGNETVTVGDDLSATL